MTCPKLKMRIKTALILFLATLCLTGEPCSDELPGPETWQAHDDIFSLCFPGKNDGWACGRWGTILYTSDGGKTWQRQKSGIKFTLADIFFINSKLGWAVGNEGTILHTVDGGLAWKKQISPVDYYHTGVFFVNSQKGWITTDQTHILYTDDGGKNWRVQFRDVEFRLKSISFSDALNGWAVGEYGYIYHTDDGGKTWQHQGGFLRFNEETADIEGGIFLFDVLAIDANTAWAVGLDGHVIRTEDGGKNWLKVATGIPETPLFCIAHHKEGHWAIGGKGVFEVSNDNGITWRKARVMPSIDYSWIYDITLHDPKRFIATGAEGAIYNRDGKDIWKRVTY